MITNVREYFNVIVTINRLGLYDQNMVDPKSKSYIGSGPDSGPIIIYVVIRATI